MVIYDEMRDIIYHGTQGKPNIFFHDGGNGEFYIPQNGITYSDPQIRDYFDTRSKLPNSAISPAWLEEETDQVRHKMTENNFSLIEGDLGSGKSTVLFGIRTLLRQEEHPYVAIDGHFLDKGDRIANAISNARDRDLTVVYDSFDYLFIKNGRRREAKRARPQVLEAVTDHLQNGGRMLATSHTSPWFGKYSNPELEAQFREFITDRDVYAHRVHGYMESEMALAGLCDKVHGAEYADVYPPYAGKSSQPTARTYRVAKLLGKRLKENGEDLLAFSQEEFDTAVAQLDADTRKRMNAPDDYNLLHYNPGTELGLTE